MLSGVVLVSSILSALVAAPTCQLLDADDASWTCRVDVLPPMRASIVRLEADCALAAIE